MFFRAFNRKKNKPYIAIILYVFITFFIISANGCHTTTIGSYSTDNPDVLKNLDGINHVILKNGTYIDTRDKKVMIYKHYKDSSNVMVISPEDSVTVNTNGARVVIPSKNETFIPLSKIKVIYVKKTEIDEGKTILLVVGIGILAAALTYITLLAMIAAGGGID
jgi:hypothetical protein